MARMVGELELLNYDATMARCSNSALKLVIWWGNNIGGGTMLISEAELKESVDLAIAYWKKQIVLCPNINDNNKECCKEFVETMVKKELGKLRKWFINNSLTLYQQRRYIVITLFRNYVLTSQNNNNHAFLVPSQFG